MIGGKKLSTNNIKKHFFIGFRNLTLLLFLILNIYPLIWVLLSSFKTNREILDSALSLPQSLHFANYIRAFSESGMVRSFFNSVFVTVISIIINVLVSFIAAYALSRYKFKFLGVILLLMSFGLLIPINSSILPIKMVMDKLFLSNSLIGLSILYAGINIPISVLILRSHIIGIPKEIDEAAALDGAGPWYTSLRIILPIARPAVVTIMILQAVYSWNEFLFAMILISDEKNKTIQLVIKNFMGVFQSDYGALFASVIVSVIPVIVFFVISQKQVITAFSSGAVKS